MPRIRSIKPEFPQSETIGKLSRDARLLFIQLWTVSDDSGRTRAASRMLASLLYPYDDDAPALIGGWLDELEKGGCIRRYEADSSSYLEIVNWLKHQKIDHPTKSRLPPFRESSRGLATSSRILATDLGSRIKDLGSRIGEGVSESSFGQNLNLESGVNPEVGARANARRPKTKGTRLQADWWPNVKNVNYGLGKGLSLERINIEGEKFRNYWTAKTGNATKLDWNATWENWVLTALERKGNGNEQGNDEFARRPGESLGELGRRMVAAAQRAERQAGN